MAMLMYYVNASQLIYFTNLTLITGYAYLIIRFSYFILLGVIVLQNTVILIQIVIKLSLNTLNTSDTLEPHIIIVYIRQLNFMGI